MQEGNEHPEFEKICSVLDKIKHKGSSTTDVGPFNMRAFYPRKFTRQKKHIHIRRTIAEPHYLSLRLVVPEAERCVLRKTNESTYSSTWKLLHLRGLAHDSALLRKRHMDCNAGCHRTLESTGDLRLFLLIAEFVDR